MKHASLLIVLCVLFGLSSYAQSTTTVEKSTKRITITTKKTDENGKTVTETYIAEGDEPEEILKGMAVDPQTIQRVDIINPDVQNEERLFLVRKAGDNVSIEGTLNENITVRESNADGKEMEKIIIINKKGDKSNECYAFMKTPGAAGHGWREGFESKSNCAALGVLVHNEGDGGGSRINSLIENGGAQAAGLKEGDVITRIDEFEVNDFATLHLALSHFKPGDVVTVRYDREGKSLKAKTELKDWKDLPGHEWRSRSDCGPETVIEEDHPESIIDNPDDPSSIESLELTDAMIFPNPTDGNFAFSFSTEPGPLSVSITDVNGKVVYHENNENPSGLYKKEIDLKDVPQGNYIISVTQGDKVFTEQISKQ
jgi:hypothetical protein